VPVPENPKIYHIVHIDRLPSIIEYGCLLSDSEVNQKNVPGTTIGMNNIKKRRLEELTLSCHPHLRVGNCVPFYFGPRSIMLYLIYANNPQLSYQGGQVPIIHLEADLKNVIEWASDENKCWAFTTSNAGSRHFEDYCEISQLSKIDWDAVNAKDWKDCKEKKQAEFLIEQYFPFDLVNRIGVRSDSIKKRAEITLLHSKNKPIVEVKPDWYY
jgi:hypothetical protein